MKYKLSHLLTLLLLILTSSSCLSSSPNLKKFLDDIENRYEQTAFELGDAYWNFYAAEEEYDLETPKDKFYNLLINDTLNTLIQEWYPKNTEIKDTILRARVIKWHSVLLAAKVEYDVEIMRLRGELEKMLEVKEGNEGSSDQVPDKMLQLIELRNKKSVELGFDNYVHLIFETNGLGYDWFMDFIEKMDQSSQEAYKTLVEEIKTEQNIEKFGQRNAFTFIGMYYRNIDATDLKNENNIELVKTSLANIGIDYNTLPAKLVEQQLPEGIGGQGLMINIPNDFRAVMTLGMDIGVWMHEMGHGLHGLYNTINTPILEGYEWVPGNANPSFAEGMAETSAYFTRNPEWLKEYTNLTEEQIAEKQKIVNKYAPAFIRYHLLNFMRETELYLHPDKTYNEIQKELARKYMMIETEEIRTQDLNNIIYVTYPLYLQNYLLADVVARQVHQTLEEKFGKDYAFNKEVGKYLAEHFYSAGEYFDWNDRLINGTGKALDIDAYLESYQIK